jgi:hypothetical protein
VALAAEVSAAAALGEAGNLASLNTEINEEILESKYFSSSDFFDCLDDILVFRKTETFAF